MTHHIFQVVTITLNPAIDQTVTIRDFSPGAVNRVERVKSSAGGKGINVAAALADYGHSVAATGFLGRENTSVFKELLTKKDVDDHFVRIDGQTRISIKIADPARGETTDINFPGCAPTPNDLALLRAQIDELSALDHAWFVIAGSLPPGVGPTFYRDLAKKLRERGQRVALDTSGEQLRHALEAQPQIVKPNIHELEALVGRRLENDAAILAAARELATRGAELVVVSMGADGALFVTKDEAITARPPKIAVKSTVGAGDAMVAGIIAARLNGSSLADTARLATAFSLDVLSRGTSGISSQAAIGALMHEVTLE